MRINKIDNNINFNAKLKIISGADLLAKNDIVNLTSKASKLGSNEDFILIGVVQMPKEKKENKISILNRFLNKNTKEFYTNISGACHSFFDIEKPDSFIKNLGSAFGKKDERAKKSYEIINKYLDDIQLGLEHNK